MFLFARKLKSFVFFLLISMQFITFGQGVSDSIKSIPISLIPDYQVKANSKFSEINRLIIDYRSQENSSESIKELKQDIEGKSFLMDSAGIENFTNDKIKKWDTKWVDIENKINIIAKPVDVNSQNFIRFHAELEGIYNLWLETDRDISQTVIPENLKQSVKDIISEAERLRQEVNEIEGEYLSLKFECNELLNKVFLNRKLLFDAHENIVKNLLVAEQDVLWQSFEEYTSDTNLTHKNIRLNDATINLVEYSRKKPSFIYIGLFSFLFFLILSIYVQRSIISNIISKNDLNDKGVAVIVKHPMLFSFLLTWMTLALAFNFPIEIRSFIQIVMLIPLLFLLIVFYGKQRIRNLLLFSFLYLFKASTFLFYHNSFIVRCYYLIVAILLVWLLWFILNRSSILVDTIKKPGFIRLVLFVSLIVNVISVLFLILGNVLLAFILIEGSVGLMLSWIILYTAFELLLSMFKILLAVPFLQRSNIIRNYSSTLILKIKNVLGFLFFISWLNLSLNNFTIKNEVVSTLLKAFRYQFTIGSTSFGLNNIIVFILAIYMSIYLSRLVLFFLEEEVYFRRQTDKGISGTFNLLIRLSIISLGFVFALAAAGIELEKISILIGALGVGIGFGLQSIFNNLFSGIILALERPIKVGDIIQVGELTGIVKSIGFRSSNVRTYDGSEVIVPNGELISNQMINWTLSDRKRRLKINVGVSYDSDPEVIIAVLKEITNNHKDVEDLPAPRPRFLGYGESSLDFQVLFWISDYENSFRIETEIILDLYKKLKELGIEIPYPKRDVRIVNNEPK